MSSSPGLGECLLMMIGTLPGALVASGLVVALVVLLGPLALPEVQGWREVERRIHFLDWGLSLAAILVGSGILLLEASAFGFGVGSSWRYRYGLSFFCFAFAGRRLVFSRRAS